MKEIWAPSATTLSSRQFILVVVPCSWEKLFVILYYICASLHFVAAAAAAACSIFFWKTRFMWMCSDHDILYIKSTPYMYVYMYIVRFIYEMKEKEYNSKNNLIMRKESHFIVLFLMIFVCLLYNFSWSMIPFVELKFFCYQKRLECSFNFCLPSY